MIRYSFYYSRPESSLSDRNQSTIASIALGLKNAPNTEKYDMFQYMSKNLKIPQPQLISWFNFSEKRGKHDVTENK